MKGFSPGEMSGKGVIGLFALFFGCALCPLIISGTFMGLYWGLAGKAAEINDACNGERCFDLCQAGSWN